MPKEFRGGFNAISIIVLIVILTIFVVGGFFGYQYLQQQNIQEGAKAPAVEPPVTPSAQIQPQTEEINTSNWKTYRNEQYGFEVRYDQNFFKEESSEEFLPPEYSKKVNGVKLIHSIPLKYCDAKGQCLPETKNMATGFYALSNDFQDIIEPLKEFFGGGVEESIIAGKKGVMIHTGAEGEGRYYYFLPSHWIGQTLMITRDYIDERMMTSYQKAREFIPLAKQEEVFDKVTKTLIFAR